MPKYFYLSQRKTSLKCSFFQGASYISLIERDALKFL